MFSIVAGVVVIEKIEYEGRTQVRGVGLGTPYALPAAGALSAALLLTTATLMVLWSPGKFYRSVGSTTDRAVKHYIECSQGQWKTVRHEVEELDPKQTQITQYFHT